VASNRTVDRSIGDPWTVLGVPHDADDEAIANAYRALARRFHPDVAGEAATRRMIRINAAFDAIRDSERREAYAEAIGGMPQSRGADGAPTYPSNPTAATDHLRRRQNDGTGAAGPPPGRPSGTVLDFGRHLGWSIGEVARVDPGYLVWLAERPDGRPYLAEIDATLRRVGYRTDPVAGRRG
jgi:DnaJ domain